MAQATSWAVETSAAVEGILAEEETLVGEVNGWNISIECDLHFGLWFLFLISCVSWLKHLTCLFRKTFSSVLCSRRLWGWWWRWWEQRKLWGW